MFRYISVYKCVSLRVHCLQTWTPYPLSFEGLHSKAIGSNSQEYDVMFFAALREKCLPKQSTVAELIMFLLPKNLGKKFNVM